VPICELLTTGEAAARLGISRQRVIRACNNNLLRSYRLPCGTHRRIPDFEVDKFLALRGPALCRRLVAPSSR
jgi:excisionase family DNA binding protein